MLGRSACFAWTIFMLFQGPFGHLFFCFTLPKPKLSTLEKGGGRESFFLEEQLVKLLLIQISLLSSCVLVDFLSISLHG